MVVPMEGIPDRDADGPRYTMAVAQRRRNQVTPVPRVDDTPARPSLVRVIVAGGRKITGELAPARLAVPSGL